jgi:hypothetical protein
MAWETRPWATTPNDQVLRATRGLRLIGKRVRLHLDPRSFETDDANLLRVEGTYMFCMSNGPTVILEERDSFLRGEIPLIDILVIEELHEES